MIGKAGNWGAGGGRQETLPVGSGGAENVLLTVSWSSAGNGESWILRGVSAGICASGKRKQELIRACSRLSDSGEWHFPLSERLKQAKSWWANKMVEQKEALLLVMKQHYTNTEPQSTVDWFDSSLKFHVCLKCVKMLYYSDSGEICKSINISKIHISCRLV